MHITKNIWLLRHGQTQYNADGRIQGRGINAPLNDKGKEQARLLAQEMQKRLEAADTRLYCSSMIRAVQTAQPLAELLGLPLNKTEALEELNYGKFEGAAFEDVEDELNQLMQEWDNGKTQVAPEGGESPQEVLNRADAFIQPLLAENGCKNLVIVAHGRVLRVLISAYLYKDLKHMSRIQHHNANINCLQFADNAFKAKIINDITHLSSMGDLT